jgi:REP-associated tyrosine transposase
MARKNDQLRFSFAATGKRSPRKRRRGRPKKPGAGVPHLARAPFSSRHPVHVTLRVCQGVYNLRSRRFFRVFERALSFERTRTASGTAVAPRSRATRAGKPAPGALRIVHYAVLGNHMHLVVEAPDQVTLSRRIQGLEIRLAKNFNRVMHARRGRVFADRYHALALKTPLEVRRVLAYVMGNASHHFRSRGTAGSGVDADAYSSAEFFDGWSAPVRLPFSMASPGRAPPVAPPRTWLLRTGWKRRGLLVPA